MKIHWYGFGGQKEGAEFRDNIGEGLLNVRGERKRIKHLPQFTGHGKFMEIGNTGGGIDLGANEELQLIY